MSEQTTLHDDDTISPPPGAEAPDVDSRGVESRGMDSTGAETPAVEHAPFLSRLGSWFRKSNSPDHPTTTPQPGNDLPLVNAQSISPLNSQLNQVQRVPRPVETPIARGWFGRPNKRDVAMARLNDGFGNLADLLGTVRDNLERQGERQDELLRCLAHLPTALEALPEANRVHGETLKAIHQQIGQQGAHQEKLADILEKLGESSSESKEVLDELGARMDHLRQTDQAISDNLSNVGENMAVASKHAATSAEVLQQMRDSMQSRDEQLQRILQRNTHRFLVMMIVSMVLALAAIAVVADLLLNKPK